MRPIVTEAPWGWIEAASSPRSASIITGGSIWNFQLWYRDQATASGLDLSDGVQVAFEP